ncbi:MAG: hypothetical protein AAF577_16175 [Pseudomonadota bacterium]
MARKAKSAQMSPVKRGILLLLLVGSFGFAGYQFYTAYRLQDPAFQRERTLGRTGALAPGMWGPAAAERVAVNLDSFVETTKPRTVGTREIVQPSGLRFTAAIKRAPEKIETKYIYQALAMMRVAPLPQINHRMFVQSAGGKILPVYVHDAAVPALTGQPLEAPVELAGFHVYTYSKGPAIVVDGWVPGATAVR